MKILKTAICFGALGIMAAPAASANDSTYTDLDTGRCTSLGEQEESGSVSLKCPGLKGYPVYFKEGDVRQSVAFGPVSKAYVDGAFESFGMFNHTGAKIEWRRDGDGRPVAAILRYFLANIDPDTGMPVKALEGQVLVVSRVAQAKDGLGCVAGYVDALANGKANDIARQVADDIAPDFACGSDEPVFHGERGDRASEPSRYLPE